MVLTWLSSLKKILRLRYLALHYDIKKHASLWWSCEGDIPKQYIPHYQLHCKRGKMANFGILGMGMHHATYASWIVDWNTNQLRYACIIWSLVFCGYLIVGVDWTLITSEFGHVMVCAYHMRTLYYRCISRGSPHTITFINGGWIRHLTIEGLYVIRVKRQIAMLFVCNQFGTTSMHMICTCFVMIYLFICIFEYGNMHTHMAPTFVTLTISNIANVSCSQWTQTRQI